MNKPQDEQGVQTAYDEVADSYADHFRSTEPEQPVELAMVAHFASLLSGERRVLDAGCGAGRLLPVLAALNCRVEGVDLSPGMIRRAQQDHPSFTTQVASLTHLPHPDGSFDGYFSWYSTIHSPGEDLLRIFGEAKRVLRTGGHLLVAFQSGRGTHDVAGAYRRHGHDITLERYRRTPDQVATVLAAARLREVARLERQPAGADERDSQAVLIAQC
ncbi:ubiquinone biosynthesis protein [Nocardioides sp. Root190]|uniref:class I SAM-dependent DNA methyltransferase n=1 Tax=Nocardioides sp. Root190 TaxID=1736488 RepID=UPI0006FD2696|nr:class I SAM-dependent methyltransferase [Nocardioides sp. Root190]KRB77428.1 ubiquinone biosynthesis protein [Nocardioides sp. Root190]